MRASSANRKWWLSSWDFWVPSVRIGTGWITPAWWKSGKQSFRKPWNRPLGIVNMVLSYGSFLNWGTSKSSNDNGVFHYKSTISGFFHLWKPPYIFMCFHKCSQVVSLAVVSWNSCLSVWSFITSWDIFATAASKWQDLLRQVSLILWNCLWEEAAKVIPR